MTRAPLFVLIASLAGCSMVPDKPEYAEPQLKSGWSHTNKGSSSATWDSFGDKTLLELQGKALAVSPSLEIAVARIAQARASAGLARSALFPSISGSAGSTQVGELVRETKTQTDSASLSVAWELDLFGKRRHDQASALATVRAKEEDLADARLLVLTETAETYFNQLVCQEQIRIQTEDLSSRQKVLKLTEAKVKLGNLAPLDLHRAQGSVHDATAQLLTQQNTCEQVTNKLEYLTGVEQGKLKVDLQAQELPTSVEMPFAQVPADAIRHRPDVRSTGHSVESAWQGIGTAKASRLPSLSLSGFIGVSSVQGGTGATNPWQFAISLLAPLFDGGAGESREDLARGKFDESVGAYKQKVRQAVKETEDALTRNQFTASRLSEAEQGKARYGAYFKGMEARYRVGYIGIADLEDARRVKLQGEQAVLQAKLEKNNAWIALHKAIGGEFNTKENTDAK